MGTIELGTTTSRVVLVIIVDWLPLVNRDRKKKKKTQNLGKQLKKKL
jgi:preprotein translocase subunit YajC